METIEIKPEYSTQPFGQKPNPMVERAIKYLIEKTDCNEDTRIMDQGCGALRHLRIFMEYFSEIYLVDTEYQMNRMREIEGKSTTIKEYINNLDVNDKKIRLISNEEFLTANLELGAIFNICTFDVTLPETRKEMLEVAKKNLRKDGYFILIIPRNDSSILCRCKTDNNYSDGYYFKNHGAYTFYTNFREAKGLVEFAANLSLEVVDDLSIYRQICLLFTLIQKQKAP